LLSKFKEFCKIDRQLSDRTVCSNSGYVYEVKRFLQTIDKPPTQITVDDVRTYLTRFQTKSASTKANVLKALRLFFNHFVGKPDVVKSFKFPRRTYMPKTVPDKDDLKRFFEALDDLKYQTAFLLYASCGLRKTELLKLSIADVDIENRTILPRNAHETSTTKNTWATCFNAEAQTYLKRFLANRRDNKDSRLIPVSQIALERAFRKASQRSGVKITAKTLREWFCCQLGELGMPDRYVDALCGRVPKSVLARHYTDYSPQKLKTIYDKANLSVLS
jgi:integrase